jgi:DMSO/TMAO reductase YedYZ molybdopterin-dependent catalytic subunit
LTTGFPVLDLGVQPDIPESEWALALDGLVEKPATLSWAAFNALPQVDDTSDFHCVTTWSKYDCRWGGVAFTTLYELAQPKPEARFVYFTSYDGYSTNVPIEKCLDDDVLVATRFDGGPLPREHGGRARVIIPKLYAWKGAKFVKAITFLPNDKLGFWEVRGYSNDADPWKEERYA